MEGEEKEEEGREEEEIGNPPPRKNCLVTPLTAQFRDVDYSVSLEIISVKYCRYV